MENDTKEIFILVVGLIIGGIIGSYATNERKKKQAINAGVAIYTVDNKTGDTTFIYLSPTNNLSTNTSGSLVE